MPLTVDELRVKQAADLQRLIARLMSARRPDGPGRLDQALEDLVNFGARTPFQALQMAAERARSAAAGEIAAVALEELAAVADRATGAGAGFKAAAMVAESGKAELLFPALAGAAAHSVEVMKRFQDAIDAVRDTVNDVDELGDVPAALDDTLAALQGLSDSLES